MLWTAAFVLYCAFGPRGTSGKVCSTTDCIKGRSSSPLLVHDKQSKNDFLPGTYSSSSDVDIHSFSPSAQLNQSEILIGNSLVVSSPPQPVIFTNERYSGDVVDETERARSVFLPPGFYGLLEPGTAVWGAVPDLNQLGGSYNLGPIRLATCDPPCASGAQCVEDTVTKGKCQCNPGWTGASCDQCAPGRFGPECKACADDCTICDDGISGTGQCLGAASTPLKDCDCTHGSCTASGDCTCAAGYITNTTSSGPKCQDCASGFFKDTQGSCMACPLGCSSCTLRDGSADAVTCTACVGSLQLNTADPARCVASAICSSGQYFDANTASCETCSPACNTCTGPSTSECLSCASPRANLAGNCVGLDATTGVCDSKLSGLQGVFIFNNAKSRCDTCPLGCASCRLPGFSSATHFASATCDACQDGFLMENGKCVEVCSEGWYLPSGTKDGKCQRCGSSCVDCIGSSTTCTKCTAPSFASDGACLKLCPTSTVPVNGTCIPCSSDCLTCSSPSSSSCVTCPSSLPVLSNGRCIEYCSSGTYFDSTSQSCKTCDSSCGSCVAPGPSKCSSCPNGSKLRNGKCVQSECKHGAVDGLGICLEELVAKDGTKNLGFIALIVLLALMGLGVWWFIKRQRQKTRLATRDFADAMDDQGVRERMMILRLERVLGLDRVRPKPAERLAEEGERKERDRLKLRELLMVSRKGKGKGTSSAKSGSDSLDVAGAVELDDVVETDKKQAQGGRAPSWFAPPAPYFPPASSSTSSLSTVTEGTTAGDTGTNSAFPPLKTKFISMSSTSPISPIFNLSGLRPPLRPMTSSITDDRRGPDVKVPLGQGGVGKDVRRTSLKRLWPALHSPSFGEKEARRQEGWI